MTLLREVEMLERDDDARGEASSCRLDGTYTTNDRGHRSFVVALSFRRLSGAREVWTAAPVTIGTRVIILHDIC